MGTCSSTSERLQKLLRYALDPSAGDGEAENAAARAIGHARQAGMDLVAFARALQAEAAEPAPQPEQACSWAEGVMLKFGRYKGRTLGEVLMIDRQYLQWIQNTHTFDVNLRCACRELLHDRVGRGGRAA
jgi:hypothetical protein